MTSILKIRKILNSHIKGLESNKTEHLSNPNCDFTRNRKLNFSDMIRMLLCMGRGSLPTEISKYMNYKPNSPSVSAFVQNRDKILPQTFETLFQKFTMDINCKTNKYRLLAIDGSDILTAPDQNEPDSYFPVVNNQKSYNLYHLNSVLDLETGLFVDALLQGRRRYNEHKALTEMVDRSNINKAILIADRGYESYNNIAHIQEKGWKFVIRTKEKNGIIKGLTLPRTEEYDVGIELNLMKSRLVRHHELLKDKNSFKAVGTKTFDYFTENPDQFYKVKFRVVRLKLSKNEYEVLLTNLEETKFSANELKQLYAKRWGIETSFRSLKYSVGLLNLRSKKSNFVKQEIFASLTMYNFAQAIKNTTEKIKQIKERNYTLNFSVISQISRQFLNTNLSSVRVTEEICRHLIPIRKRERSPRIRSSRKLKSFNYRIV